jgi:hypothetical protein
MKTEEFFVREKANAGITIKLPLPDGTDSNETITVRGIDSDHFRKAKNDRARKNLEILQLPEAEQDEAFETADNELLSSLIAGWSLETEFTQENVMQLLYESPAIKELVDATAAARARFFGKG